jgi:hypothetical protein
MVPSQTEQVQAHTYAANMEYHCPQLDSLVPPALIVRASRHDVVRLIGWDLYGVLVDPPPWAEDDSLHVIWEDDDYVCVYTPEEIENVSALNDENARAVIRQCADSLEALIRHFDKPDACTWEDFGGGRNEAYLEQVKMDLTMLASVVEARIQEISPPVSQEFGT